MKFVGIDSVVSNLKGYIEDKKAIALEAMDYTMTDAENTSKHSAPWTDRTSNARNSIFGFAEVDGKKIIGYHGIGVYYGVYLELSHGGKYRVIQPTMDYVRNKFFGNLQGLW